MQSLLSPARRPEPAPESRERAPETVPDPAPPERPQLAPGIASILPVHSSVLIELQGDLKRQGIASQPAEILSGIVEALMKRPKLCRGLLAAHLLGDGKATRRI